MLLTRWRDSHNARERATTTDHVPFLNYALQFLPEDSTSVIIDIGAGNGEFVEAAFARYPNVYGLEQSEEALVTMRNKGLHCKTYTAPATLPFEADSVAFVHTSHMIEHLQSDELYAFLCEVDRVLCVGGKLVISAPLMWHQFYDDLSHVRPYPPSILEHYLTKAAHVKTAESISTQYVIDSVVFRQTSDPPTVTGSKYFVVDLMCQAAHWLRSKLGVREYSFNGYTIVLTKGEAQ